MSTCSLLASARQRERWREGGRRKRGREGEREVREREGVKVGGERGVRVGGEGEDRGRW